MKKQSTQWILSGLAVGVAAVVFSQSYSTANAQAYETYKTTPAQKITTTQVAQLLNRSHYLNQKFDKEMGQKILNMFFDKLDGNHTLFLQSDIDEFTKKYSNNFADLLKAGDLSAGVEIYERYRQRANEYYDYSNKILEKEVDLTTDQKIILNREEKPRFDSKKEQEVFWHNQITAQLIGMTLSQEDEKAKEKVFLENPDITRGQDLIRDDKRSPAQILSKRLTRRQGQMNRIKDDEIMESILDTATMTYDPHSNYYAPIQATEMQIQSNLELEGIGVSIRPDRKNPDYTRIVTIVSGGPAEKSGKIKRNDLIVAIAKDGTDMQDVVGWSTREVVGLIRGKRGTKVALKVKQPNQADSSARLVMIERDIIKQEESGVQHRVIEVKHKGAKKRIGVLEIPSFYLNFKARQNGKEDYRSVTLDTENALIALKKQNVDGLVVDLRNNPGGNLSEVADMLGLFIKKGPLVQIRDAKGDVKIFKDVDGGSQVYDGKMSVLINLGSASASEIFAAAIQDYGRGLVVGSTTTGKGSAQVHLNDHLALGSITLTQRKFYRINGGSTQNKGVVPDIDLVNIYKGLDYGERSTKNPLVWDTIETADYKPEGKYSSSTIKTLTEASNIRQNIDPQFVYLKTLNTIRDMEDDKKPIYINIDKRRDKAQKIENLTLEAENKRRAKTGKKAFKDWNVYQAELDAKFEERSNMKENERPPLPEEETYVIEAARLMLDADADVVDGK